MLRSGRVPRFGWKQFQLNAKNAWFLVPLVAYVLGAALIIGTGWANSQSIIRTYSGLIRDNQDRYLQNGHAPNFEQAMKLETASRTKLLDRETALLKTNSNIECGLMMLLVALGAGYFCWLDAGPRIKRGSLGPLPNHLSP